jgi:hypothetical protein
LEHRVTKTITVHFDGRVLVPDEPVELPIGPALRVSVEAAEPVPDKFADLRALAVDLPDAPSDLSAQHDHYLYGHPKK